MNKEDDTQATTDNAPPELEQPPVASSATTAVPSATPESTPQAVPPQSTPRAAPQSAQYVTPIQSPQSFQPMQRPAQYMTPPFAHPLQQSDPYMAQSAHPLQQPIGYPTAQPMEQMVPVQRQLSRPGYQVPITYSALMRQQMQPMHAGYQIPGPQMARHSLPAGHHHLTMAQPQPVIRIQPERSSLPALPSSPLTFGKQPQTICCPECRKIGKTRISYEIGNCAWIAFCFCFWTVALTLCSPCAFCIQQWQDVDHYCSNCNHLVGTYKR